MEIPPNVACPHCGGYVRGHMWIGAEDCSITKIDWEPLPNDNLPACCMRCGDAHVCPPGRGRLVMII